MTQSAGPQEEHSERPSRGRGTPTPEPALPGDSSAEPAQMEGLGTHGHTLPLSHRTIPRAAKSSQPTARNRKAAGAPREDGTRTNETPILTEGSRVILAIPSVPGKLAGTRVKDRTAGHTDEQNLLGKSQRGFCKGQSCLIDLLKFFEGVSTRGQGDPVATVHLDFQKAVDKVPHQRLLSKVSFHGIRGKVP